MVEEEDDREREGGRMGGEEGEFSLALKDVTNTSTAVISGWEAYGGAAIRG